MRKMLTFVLAALVVSLSGCSTLTAYAKQEIRNQAILASDALVDRVITKVGEKLNIEVSEETEAEIRAAAKEAAREEIDKLLSDDEIDRAANAKPPEEKPDATSEPAPAPAPAPEPQ